MSADRSADDGARASVAEAFRVSFGTEPAGIWAAPGRVNLIGEHTDYNDGFVLPFALQHDVLVAVAPSRTDGSRVRSLQRSGEVQFAKALLEPGAVAGWGAYIAGVLWALREAGHRFTDVDLVVDGRVPLGAGLSSSAALECAVGLAAAELFDLGLDRTELAMLARRAENHFVGVATGGMDQLAVMHGTPGHALLIDTRTNSLEPVGLPLGDDLALVVIDTGVHHALVDGEYASRRRTCDEAAQMLGVRALRDVTAADLADALAALEGDVARRRVRHVVTENARVLETVAALKCVADPVEIGDLLCRSHESLRDDYEVTTPELDCAVASAMGAGAFGARMTGGGFGGSVIALTPGARIIDVTSAVETAFADAGWAAPKSFLAIPSGGAHRLR
jgi:galactokinase